MSATAIIVDDSPMVRAVLRRGLTNAGFAVAAEESSAERVLELYESLHPSLIVLDIVLPGGDGAELATEILRKHPEANVVMCSSLVAREKVLACRQAGVSHFIIKPFSLEKVREVIEKIASRLVPAQAQTTAA